MNNDERLKEKRKGDKTNNLREDKETTDTLNEMFKRELKSLYFISLLR